MPTTNDYLVNTQFKMGGDDSIPAVTPAPVAPATARMKGGKQQMSPTGSPQTPLMPAAEVSGMSEGQNSITSDPQSQVQAQSQPQRNGRPRAMEPKQFHRKSLGDWDFLETVGAGSMGKVKLAKHHYTNEVCAIKIVNRATKAFLHKEQSLPPPQNEQEMLERQKKLEKEISRDKRTIREASLGQILYHPHICRLFEMCTMSNHFYMLFEYVSGGQLLDYIIQHGSLREHHARTFARGVASALQYLHANNIVHRDLKIENIMISTSGEIKIIDFGLSNLFDSRKQLHTFCGSLYFAAPELLKASPYIGPEVDVWSFGVVLYVLVCGKVPFDDENSSVLHEKIKQGKVEYPQHLSIEVISLLSKMLVVDPKRRASLKQVVEHHWMIRGFDFPAPSYVPNRIPLTTEMLDINVVKEMFRLEFVDDIDETIKFLQKIIKEDTYVKLSQQYWATLTSLNARNVSPSNDINRTMTMESGNLAATNSPSAVYADKSFEDPTRAYHPLLSIYYLVDEMLRRKLVKLQKKQQQQQIQQQQQQQQRQEIQQQQNIQRLERPIETPQGFKRLPQGAQIPIPQINQPNVTENITNTNNTTLDAPRNMSNPPIASSQRRLQVLVPPKLAIPEQAHTSPTAKKSIDDQTEPEYVLSPIPQASDYQQRSSSPITMDTSEKPKFGNIFRKLSQRRSKQQQPQQQEQQTQLQKPIRLPETAQPVPQVRRPQIEVSNEDGKSLPKTHSRAVSECTPASMKVPIFGEPSVSRPLNTIRSPTRSASQKQNSELPALPLNAESLVKQQREKQGLSPEDTETTLTTNKLIPSEGQDESKPLPPLNVTKGRKLHPSARAKSVGHTRREYSKYMRPPVSADISPEEYPEHGILGYGDDNKAVDDLSNGGGSTSPSALVSSLGMTTGHSSTTETVHIKPYNEELTDEQILEEASKAPPGSMPSIDYPRSLFLKGFFSVQTTSSKPLPIVRYKIIHVLKQKHIQFKEVKGGFVCIQKLSIHNAKETEAPRQQQQQAGWNAASPVHGRSNSRHGSLRLHGVNKYSQTNALSSPLPNNGMKHERNLSIVSSPHQSNMSGELSSASLESMNQDDILTTSRVHDMNKKEIDGEISGAIERPPIKFEIHIVKVRIVGLAGVHFKKMSGNTWMYKELASEILRDLNL